MYDYATSQKQTLILNEIQSLNDNVSSLNSSFIEAIWVTNVLIVTFFLFIFLHRILGGK